MTYITSRQRLNLQRPRFRQNRDVIRAAEPEVMGSRPLRLPQTRIILVRQLRVVTNRHTDRQTKTAGMLNKTGTEFSRPKLRPYTNAYPRWA